VEETSPGLMQAGIAPCSHAEHGASAHSAAVPQPEQQQRQPTRTATLSRRHRRRRTCHTIACHHLTFGGDGRGGGRSAACNGGLHHRHLTCRLLQLGRGPPLLVL
jgi:hypothetical protein